MSEGTRELEHLEQFVREMFERIDGEWVAPTIGASAGRSVQDSPIAKMRCGTLRRCGNYSISNLNPSSQLRAAVDGARHKLKLLQVRHFFRVEALALDPVQAFVAVEREAD